MGLWLYLWLRVLRATFSVHRLWGDVVKQLYRILLGTGCFNLVLTGVCLATNRQWLSLLPAYLALVCFIVCKELERV